METWLKRVGRTLLRELHLHVARAERRLLLGALLQLKRVDDAEGDRRCENGDAGRDDAQVPDERSGRAGRLRQPRIGARNAAASPRPGIRHFPPEPCKGISEIEGYAHALSPTKRALQGNFET